MFNNFCRFENVDLLLVECMPTSAFWLTQIINNNEIIIITLNR